MAGREFFDPGTLTRLRQIPLETALTVVSVHATLDSTYVPVKNARSRRWHVRTQRGHFELLTTTSKWFDVRARRGGGGAIDLAMHLLGLSFVDAVKHLAAVTNAHGSDHS